MTMRAKAFKIERFTFQERCWAVLLIVFLGAGFVACERTPDQASEPPKAVVAEKSGLIHLTSEELARTTIEFAPVARGALLVPRQYTATVQANQNELAEVTALIRGRVVKVYVDVGQDVKKDALLAMLHSTDLGVAEGDYLKAAARLHEAELAYRRATDLYEQKVVSLAELQRREATMKTARAEVREMQNRLELLRSPHGRRSSGWIASKRSRPTCLLRAPFDGRVIMRNITRGEVVETEQKLFTVADLSDLWVIGNVPEKDVQFIRKDQKVEVIVSAYPHGDLSGHDHLRRRCARPGYPHDAFAGDGAESRSVVEAGNVRPRSRLCGRNPGCADRSARGSPRRPDR